MDMKYFKSSQDFDADYAFGTDMGELAILGKIGNVSITFERGHGCTLEEANAYGAVDKFLRIYNFYRNEEVADFFRDAIKLLMGLGSYSSMPHHYKIEGHRANYEILVQLMNGKHGFTLWDFFHEQDIKSIGNYLRWIENPDYSERDREIHPSKPREGNVYLMRDNRSGYHKIGFTSGEPTFRESTLQAEQPDIELIWHVWKDMAYEAYLHEIFADKRVRGEWFDLDENDLQEIFEMSEES